MTRRAWVLFGAMCLIWGTPYLLIRVAVEQVSPVEIVFVRSALGALVLLPWALRTGALRVALRAWRPVLLFAGLEMMGPWLLIAYAEQDLSSSLAGLLVAAVPLVAALAGRAVGEADRLDRGRLAGLLIGFGGVAVLLGLDVRGDLVAVGAMGLVVLGYATAPLLLSRSLREVPASGITVAALGATALVYLPLAAPALAGPLPSGRAVGAVLALGLVCTALALVLFFQLIAEAGPHRALVITYLNPVVAVALGMALLDEPFTRGTAVGFPLVLLGCVLATRANRSAAPRTRNGVPQPVAAP